MLEIDQNKKTRPKFWDILLVRESGEWLGIRAPWDLLQRVASYLAVLLLLSVLSVSGWISARWMSHRLRENLVQEKLKSRSLEVQVQELRRQGPATLSDSTQAEPKQVSLLPSLDKEEFSSGVLKTDSFVAEYDPKSSDFSIKFDVARLESAYRENTFYWVALLHSSAGILVFPNALNSQNGEALLPHRGQVIEALQKQRSVLARYKVKNFIENSASDPVYTTLSIYDSKGSLLLRKRADLSLKGARSGSEGEGRP